MASNKAIPNNRKIVDVRICRNNGRSPISRSIECAHAKPGGPFAAVKRGYAIPWEEIDEEHFMWISEKDFRIHTVILQPFRMEFHFEGGDLITYVPDMERRLDGSIQINEIRKTHAEVSDPHYALKLSLARDACQTNGWTFRIIVADKHILPRRLLDNVRRIRLDRFTRVTSEDHLRLGDAIQKSHSKQTYGHAVAALSGRNDPWDPGGARKLHALIVRRVVCVDLTRPLTQNSSVVLYRHPILAKGAA